MQCIKGLLRGHLDDRLVGGDIDSIILVASVCRDWFLFIKIIYRRVILGGRGIERVHVLGKLVVDDLLNLVFLCK